MNISTSTPTSTGPDQARSDTVSLRLVHGSAALGVACSVVMFVVLTFFTTTDEGDFKYAADYWLTANGLPFAVAGIGLVLGVHRLQHGSDGRLGTIGTWINTIALIELFAQCAASVVVGSELRWGPSYPVFTALTFVGVALVAAGSWRTGLLPRWMLGVWPLAWVLGSFAAFGPMPLVLIAFLVVLAATLDKRVDTSR